ncbi:YeiH family protein [Metabacillus arenae]|uniref:YeiH family putative sulfate export transporter n=1 Tax=Metabacillus arenae TaxID=2771434 RepID=A0A926S3U9_9BACI|nr:YeiH family protein [Metabacillus arenae]MBD1383329.1 YeiH family putative sulfate export transporter [Metabacillus arenae]
MAIERQKKQIISIVFVKGIGVTFLLAMAAKYLSEFPFLSIMGQLVIAIMLGIVWRATIGVKETFMPGVSFSSKKLLRTGIVLLGMRLNLADIYHAGLSVFIIAIINIAFALLVVYGLTRLFGVEKKLSILTACGTAICGAAAVVAIAPQIKAKDEETAIGAASVAVLGTIFTLVYTLLYSTLHLSEAGYGVFSGGTLHEVAHVIAAAAPGGKTAVDMAVIVKLTRVALLVPVAIMIGYLVQKGEPGNSKKSISFTAIPWFILGFIAMSGFNTLGIVSDMLATHLVNLAYLFIGMAMAGLGLNVDIAAFGKLGTKSFTAGFIGSILLSIVGYVLVFLFHLN